MTEAISTQDRSQAMAAKLNGMSFTEEERSLLHGIFHAAAADEVEGFAVTGYCLKCKKTIEIKNPEGTPLGRTGMRTVAKGLLPLLK